MRFISVFIYLFVVSILCVNLYGDVRVKITNDVPYLMVNHFGQDVNVSRIQDTNNILTDDYSKTSRECPPFCIHPTHVADNVKTIGEIELIHFMRDKVNKKRGLIVDARLKSWYSVETIPTAINIPYPLMEKSNKKIAKKVFEALGMKVLKDGRWDFSNAKELAVFCNGVWCDQSHRLITGMLKYGYPADKILYYRNGFQGWKLLGLTTIVQNANKE